MTREQKYYMFGMIEQARTITLHCCIAIPLTVKRCIRDARSIARKTLFLQRIEKSWLVQAASHTLSPENQYSTVIKHNADAAPGQ